ncbi:hypothetical protein AK812_SmicGene48585, partial [Symbiodinium microadriaticum]
MVGTTPSPTVDKGSVNVAVPADGTNEDTLPASFEEMEAVAAMLQRNPALKRNVWGDDARLEEPASRRPFLPDEPETSESPVPLGQRTPSEAFGSPCRVPRSPGSTLSKMGDNSPKPTISPLQVGVGVAEAKAAKTRVRTISMVAEVAAQA